VKSERKGLIERAFDQGFKPPQNQTHSIFLSKTIIKLKTLTKKSKILRKKVNYAMLPLFLCCWTTRLYSEAWMFSATRPKEDEEAIVTQLTTVHSRHHGSIVVLAGMDFLPLSCSTGVESHGCPWGGSKYIQWGSNAG